MAIAAARVFHVNVNCSDLDRSVAFYRDRLGLVPAARTRPLAPQPGGAFGLETAQWDAFMMTGRHGGAGPVIDLLEWKVPEPTGTPHSPAPAPLGLARLRLDSAVAERPGTVTDPDGTTIDVNPADTTAVTGVEIGCTDAARSTEFYTDVLAFTPRRESAGDDRGGVGLADPAGAFVVDLAARPGAPSPYPVANHLGMYRMALMTDAIDDDYDALCARAVRCISAPATLDMGPGLPALRAVLFLDPDGTTLELIETPQVRSG